VDSLDNVPLRSVLFAKTNGYGNVPNGSAAAGAHQFTRSLYGRDMELRLERRFSPDLNHWYWPYYSVYFGCWNKEFIVGYPNTTHFLKYQRFLALTDLCPGVTIWTPPPEPYERLDPICLWAYRRAWLGDLFTCLRFSMDRGFSKNELSLDQDVVFILPELSGFG